MSATTEPTAGPSLDAQANAVTLIRAQVRKLAAEGKLPEPKESAA